MDCEVGDERTARKEIQSPDLNTYATQIHVSFARSKATIMPAASTMFELRIRATLT